MNNSTSIVYAIVNHSDTGAPRVGRFNFGDLELDRSFNYSVTVSFETIYTSVTFLFLVI